MLPVRHGRLTNRARNGTSYSFSRPFRVALNIVVLAHTAFFADYYRLTDGCFCVVTGLGLPVHRMYPGELQFLRYVALPVTSLHMSSGWLGEPSQVVLLGVANALLWFLGCAILLALWQRSRNRVSS